MRHEECRQSESPRSAHGSGNLWIHRRYESSLNFRSACCRGPHPAAERTFFKTGRGIILGNAAEAPALKCSPRSQNSEKKKNVKVPGAQPGFSKVDTPTVPLIVKRSVGEKLALPRPVDVSHRAQAWSLAMTERGVDDQLVLPSSPRGPCA